MLSTSDLTAVPGYEPSMCFESGLSRTSSIVSLAKLLRMAFCDCANFACIFLFTAEPTLTASGFFYALDWSFGALIPMALSWAS